MRRCFGSSEAANPKHAADGGRRWVREMECRSSRGLVQFFCEKTNEAAGDVALLHAGPNLGSFTCQDRHLVFVAAHYGTVCAHVIRHDQITTLAVEFRPRMIDDLLRLCGESDDDRGAPNFLVRNHCENI